VRDAGQDTAGLVERDDLERAKLLGADDPRAEVGVQRAAVLLAVLDDGEVPDLRRGPPNGDDSRMAWRDVWCVWNFAVVGRGTPGLWDAPSRVVATGPYRWVRNPIYIAALVIVLGEAWLFLSPRLLAYAGAMAVFFQLFVTGYEERRLARRFGRSYLEYRSTVPRWIPRPPPTSKIS
jgi:hypothetical protein